MDVFIMGLREAVEEFTKSATGKKFSKLIGRYNKQENDAKASRPIYDPLSVSDIYNYHLL